MFQTTAPSLSLGDKLKDGTMSSVPEKKHSAAKLSDARISPLAGKPAPREMLMDLARLEKEYFDCKPDLEDANRLVVFGTSGHRGTSLGGCEIRVVRGSAIRNGKHLQDLCRKLQRQVTSECNHSRGAGDR